MMKAFLQKYNGIKEIIILFMIYMIGFFLLERWTSSRMIMTSSILDEYIPFNEYFVIPYLLWFIYIGLGFLYFMFIDNDGLRRTTFYLFTGMYICLIIYFLFPNGQDLRVTLNNDNLFQCLVSFLYTIDSSTNVCPSIHVYNSLMMLISLGKSQLMRSHQWIMCGSAVLAVLICISTVMIKQHAIIDVFMAILLVIIVYYVGKKKYQY